MGEIKPPAPAPFFRSGSANFFRRIGTVFCGDVEIIRVPLNGHDARLEQFAVESDGRPGVITES